MEKFISKIWKYKVDHLLLWAALFSYLLINRSYLIEKAGLQYYLEEVAIRILLIAFLIYSNIYFLIPYFLSKKKYLLYTMVLLFVISLYVICRNYQDVYMNKYIMQQPEYAYFNYTTFPNISNAILYTCLCIALKISKQYYLQQLQMQQIKIEKLDTELKYLKAQINPHTMFNSINSIFSLIDKSNVSARETLAKFSEILRYQLYESSLDKIDIEKEINYLHNFVELQKLRKSDNAVIDFKISPVVKNFNIAPLLIAPFVENAFKHVSNYEEQENRISISLDKDFTHFILQVINTSENSKIISVNNHGGIGLQNVKRRLELLYPDKHILDIEKENNCFFISLKIEVQ